MTYFQEEISMIGRVAEAKYLIDMTERKDTQLMAVYGRRHRLFAAENRHWVREAKGPA